MQLVEAILPRDVLQQVGGHSRPTYHVMFRKHNTKTVHTRILSNFLLWVLPPEGIDSPYGPSDTLLLYIYVHRPNYSSLLRL